MGSRASSSIVLAAIAVHVFVAPLAAQTKPPARTAQRAPAGAEKQPPAAPPRNQAVAPQQQGGARPADQAPPAANANPLVIQPPFTLTDTQQQLLDQILKKWELKSNKVTSFKCSFQRWDYDPTFGQPKDNLKVEA